MGHYNNFSPTCKNDNQRLVLKSTLILFALQQKNLGGRGGATSLLRSTQKNICAYFVGTPLENEVRPTLNYFVDRGIISALEEGSDTNYIMATTQIDPARMKNIQEIVRREKSFDAIIKDDSYGVAKKFKPTDYLKYRLDVQIISPTKFLQTSAANIQLDDNQILAFYIFAANEDEQGKVNQTIQRIHENFGSGIEEISINDKLFSPSGMTENVARYALSGERIKGSSSWLNLLSDPFRELILRGGDKYWLAMPSHTISKMKLVVDTVIENGLAQRNEVAFSDIWDALKKPPVGLLKCPGSIFPFTLLLKNYADKNFYVRDVNSNKHALTGERLYNLILNTVKELPGAQDKFIVKQTPKHIKFCQITSDIFNLPKEKINSVDDAAKNIKVRLTQSHYPLWSLKYFVEETYFDAPHKETYLRFLALFEELINPRIGRDVTKVADEIF